MATLERRRTVVSVIDRNKIPQLRAKGTKKEKYFEKEFRLKLHDEKWVAIFTERETNTRIARRSRRPSCTDSGESTPVSYGDLCILIEEGYWPEGFWRERERQLEEERITELALLLPELGDNDWRSWFS